MATTLTFSLKFSFTSTTGSQVSVLPIKRTSSKKTPATLRR
ncbi:hypothetical protein [Pseudomonas sp. GM74]|nr:hypothetical protein [Pseudomonas sp. GM74]